MCFYATKQSQVNIAKADIECWKFVNPDLTNAFSKHLKLSSNVDPIQYKVGYKMPKIVLAQNKWRTMIEKGYHSFKRQPNPSDAFGWRVDSKRNIIVRKFIIPKGALYFENEKEYVSETIILAE